MPYKREPLRPHWVPEKKPYAKYQGTNNFYANYKWKKVAKAHKQKNPCCEICNEKGFVSAVEVTDHIIRMEDGGDPYHSDNLQSLCKKCHGSKSGKEAHGIYNIPKGKGKLKDK